LSAGDPTRRDPSTRDLTVRQLREDERGWLERELTRRWGSPQVVSRGRLHDATRLPALVCEAAGALVGLATFEIREGECELVTLDAFNQGRGIGSALLAAVVQEANQHRCGRLWLITTNDNLRALRFYQRRDLRLAALHPGAVEESRRLKPMISLVGENGIPIRDEIELELVLGAEGG
jgi:GNAT superfamily N-acetyltransferase